MLQTANQSTVSTEIRTAAAASQSEIRPIAATPAAQRQQSGSIRYNLKAAQTLLREHVQRTSGLRTSARNVFHGRIEHLRASGIIVTVVLCTAGGLRVTAMITDESCKSLGLSKDMLVTASIKAPWIIIEPDQGQDKPPVATRNCFRGTVERVRQD